VGFGDVDHLISNEILSMSDRFKFEERQKGKKGDPSLFEEAS
jgi:hypothetical protein